MEVRAVVSVGAMMTVRASVASAFRSAVMRSEAGAFEGRSAAGAFRAFLGFCLSSLLQVGAELVRQGAELRGFLFGKARREFLYCLLSGSSYLLCLGFSELRKEYAGDSLVCLIVLLFDKAAGCHLIGKLRQ